MQIDLIKCHGSGNDFLLIDEINHEYNFTENDRATLAQLLCDRKGVLGADGILFTMNSSKADARMRVFNSDGSEASMCGNGLRCVARFVCELLGVDEAIIETMKTNLAVKKHEDIFPDVPAYRVGISPVSFKAKDLPLHIENEKLINETIGELSKSLTFTALAVPNPHLVSIVDQKEMDSDSQREISAFLNGENNICPDGVNVSFVKVIEKGSIFVRTFERGVGFTNACGTAMSASTLVTCLNGLNDLEEPVNVYNNGGMVQCIAHENDGSYSIDLIGNATYLFKASAEVKDDHSSFAIHEKKDFSEQEKYELLQEKVKSIL